MSPNTSRRRQKAAPPSMTGQEALYLRFLSEKQVPVNVKLRDGEVVSGWIEYYDDGMIRLTREDKPNLFIYKQQIRTISELVRKEEGRRRRELGIRERAAVNGNSLAAADGQDARLAETQREDSR
jgi:host factor-I protein